MLANQPSTATCGCACQLKNYRAISLYKVVVSDDEFATEKGLAAFSDHTCAFCSFGRETEYQWLWKETIPKHRLPSVTSKLFGFSRGGASISVTILEHTFTHRSAHFAVVAQMGFRDRIASVFRFLADQPEAKTLMQAAQFASTLLFVVLYIWSTYSPPPLWSIRYNLDLFLCIMFAIDYVSRLLVRTAILNLNMLCMTTSKKYYLHQSECTFKQEEHFIFAATHKHTESVV